MSYRDFVEAVAAAARTLAPRDTELQQEVDRALDEVRGRSTGFCLPSWPM